jgi:hypothetical protein
MYDAESRPYTLIMPRHLKVLLNLATLLIAAGSTQATSYALNRACKEATFSGTINGGQEFTSQISSNLEVHLAPKENEGWDISVRPHGSDDDWTLPVNLPISGEAQNLGTGWAMTAEDSLSEPRSLRFVLTQTEYDYYWQLAYGPHAREPNAATDFIKKIGKAKAGKIVFMPLDRIHPAKYTVDGVWGGRLGYFALLAA